MQRSIEFSWLFTGLTLSKRAVPALALALVVPCLPGCDSDDDHTHTTTDTSGDTTGGDSVDSARQFRVLFSVIGVLHTHT